MKREGSAEVQDGVRRLIHIGGQGTYRQPSNVKMPIAFAQLAWQLGTEQLRLSAAEVRFVYQLATEKLLLSIWSCGSAFRAGTQPSIFRILAIERVP